MVMKLYGLPMSTCTTCVMSCLHEKGVEFELVPVNFQTSEHKQPPFLTKNPFGQIPALEDGDLTLFESRAITAYVADKYKESGTDLIRRTSIKEAALVKVWMEVESHHFNPVTTPIIFQYLVGPVYGLPKDQTVIDTNVEKLGKVFDVYESRLSETKYLAGDFFSLADLHHVSYLHYLMKTPVASLVDDRPHVKAWWDDVSSRPAFQKIAPAMTFG